MLTTVLLLAAMFAVEPLPLPRDFDAVLYMRGDQTDGGVLHPTREAANHLASLIRNGTPEDIALARHVFEALLFCQEQDPSRRHYGNFRWMREDDDVTDFNAVSFCLKVLIPAMRDHGENCPADLREDIHAMIRRGLVETQRRDVSIAYTNIAVFDISNLILGGDLLGDEAYAEAGREKLQRWAAFTLDNGTAAEYNSPTYTRIAVNALGVLMEQAPDEVVRVTAKSLAARLSLEVALRIHPTTERWAGPHSRAYHPTVVAERSPEIGDVHGWLEHGTAPPWVASGLSPAKLPFSIRATADRENEVDVNTYMTEAFALGVTSRSVHPQCDGVYLQYNRPGAKRPGILYTRYLLDDKWFGDFYHTTDRTHTRNLNDEGVLLGVQSGPRAIALYGARPLGKTKSAKAVLIWTGADAMDTIWVDGQTVDTVPVTVQDRGLVIVGSGDVYMAVHPFSRTDLGGSPPVQLVERGGDLVLEIYNYRGERPVFRSLLGTGRDRVGRPECGFYLEVGEKKGFDSPDAFAASILSGTFLDDVAPVAPGERPDERLWSAGYARNGKNLGLTVDLMRWQLRERWTEDGPLGWPQAEAPMFRQNADGSVTLGDATLTCGPHPAWLYAMPEAKTYAAGYFGPPGPLTLATPDGEVSFDTMGTGLVSIVDGNVTVDALGVTPSEESGAALLTE